MEKTNQSDSEYKDFIDKEFKQDGFKIIKDSEKIEFFKEKNYFTVLTVLRERPMTVKEITVKYNQKIEEKSKIFNWSEKERTARLRTDKTYTDISKILLELALLLKQVKELYLVEQLQKHFLHERQYYFLWTKNT